MTDERLAELEALCTSSDVRDWLPLAQAAPELIAALRESREVCSAMERRAVAAEKDWQQANRQRDEQAAYARMLKAALADVGLQEYGHMHETARKALALTPAEALAQEQAQP